MPAVEFSQVSKRYQTKDGEVTALNNVSLVAKKGTVQGIIGFSGAGKSTLVRCITGLEKPDSGSVTVAGTNIAKATGANLRAARRNIGMISQSFHLLHSRTALKNVVLPLELAGVPRYEREQKARELLNWVGLGGRESAYPAQLSGGQRQRVAIARALAADPQVLLCDEATSALDAETTQTILALLKRVRNEFGVTIVFVTHELPAVTALCDRVAVLDEGQVVEEGATTDVFTNPQSSAAKRLLGVQA